MISMRGLLKEPGQAPGSKTHRSVGRPPHLRLGPLEFLTLRIVWMELNTNDIKIF